MHKRIRRIAEKIIQESFPVLREKKILYISVYLRFFAFSAWIPPFLRIIAISTRTAHLNDFVIEGIIAHELCHQERYIEMGTAAYLKFIIRYTFLKQVRVSEERATDTLTIEKGYAKQLYDLTLISSGDKNHQSIIDNYLSPEEIKEYATSNGRW